MDNFIADFDKRISKTLGDKVIQSGKHIGDSEHVKDCYWSGYSYQGIYYLSLNDDPEACWEVNGQTIRDYCETN